MELIVKVQRPLRASDPAKIRHCLIYDCARGFYRLMDMSEAEMARVFPNHEPKVYMRCRVKGNHIELLDHVPAESW